MNNLKIEIKWALIFFAMGLTWMLLERLLGLHSTHIDKHATFTNLIFIPAILIYVLALRDKKRSFYNGTMSYKQGFISGLILTLFVTLLSPISQFITSNIISPEYFNNMITHTVENGQMTQNKAEGFFNMKNFIVVSMMSAPVVGLLTSAIVAFFYQKQRRKLKYRRL